MTNAVKMSLRRVHTAADPTAALRSEWTPAQAAEFAATSSHRFRSFTDVHVAYLHAYYMLEQPDSFLARVIPSTVSPGMIRMCPPSGISSLSVHSR